MRVSFIIVAGLVMLLSPVAAAKQVGDDIALLCQNLAAIEVPATFDAYLRTTESKDERTLILLLKQITNCMLMSIKETSWMQNAFRCLIMLFQLP